MRRYILNPNSGPKRLRPAILAEATRACQALGAENAQLCLTERAGHAAELAREAADRRWAAVVAIGGDGTVNEIAGSLEGSTTALALVPCGSGNGLARHLGIPLGLREALALAAAPDPRILAIDLGTASGRIFANALGIGFDAELARRFNQSKRRGLTTYLRLGLRLYCGFKPFVATVSSEGKAVDNAPSLLLAFANSTQYGSGAQLAPWAKIDDGLIEMVAVSPANSFLLSLDTLRFFTGKLRGSPRLRTAQGSSFLVEVPPGTCFHVDGEALFSDTGQIHVGIKKAALKVIVPR